MALGGMVHDTALVEGAVEGVEGLSTAGSNGEAARVFVKVLRNAHGAICFGSVYMSPKSRTFWKHCHCLMSTARQAWALLAIEYFPKNFSGLVSSGVLDPRGSTFSSKRIK